MGGNPLSELDPLGLITQFIVGVSGKMSGKIYREFRPKTLTAGRKLGLPMTLFKIREEYHAIA